MVYSTGKIMRNFNNLKVMTSRRRKFRRRFPRINNFADTAGKVFGLQKQINIMKGMINSEKKYTDVSLGGAVSSTGSIQLINNIAQGDDVANRDGNSILHKYIKAEFSTGQNSAATDTFIRIVVFVDTANQGSTPAITDVLTAATPDSLKNVDNQKRFVILRDKRYALSINGTRATMSKMYIPTNFHCRYSSTTGTSVLQNSLYYLSISSEATNTPIVVANFRNAFYDN